MTDKAEFIFRNPLDDVPKRIQHAQIGDDATLAIVQPDRRKPEFYYVELVVNGRVTDRFGLNNALSGARADFREVKMRVTQDHKDLNKLRKMGLTAQPFPHDPRGMSEWFAHQGIDANVTEFVYLGPWVLFADPADAELYKARWLCVAVPKEV